VGTVPVCRYYITSTSFTANWSSSTGATSYRLYVATDAAFTNMVTGYNDLNVGNLTSYNVTGLSSLASNSVTTTVTSITVPSEIFALEICAIPIRVAPEFVPNNQD